MALAKLTVDDLGVNRVLGAGDYKKAVNACLLVSGTCDIARRFVRSDVSGLADKDGLYSNTLVTAKLVSERLIPVFNRITDIAADEARQFAFPTYQDTTYRETYRNIAELLDVQLQEAKEATSQRIATNTETAKFFVPDYMHLLRSVFQVENETFDPPTLGQMMELTRNSLAVLGIPSSGNFAFMRAFLTIVDRGNSTSNRYDSKLFTLKRNEGGLRVSMLKSTRQRIQEEYEKSVKERDSIEPLVVTECPAGLGIEGSSLTETVVKKFTEAVLPS